MVGPGVFSELTTMEGKSLEGILSDMLNDDNISLKSELSSPLCATKLKILGKWLQRHDLLDEVSWVEGEKEVQTKGNICDLFLEVYLRYQVSKDRKGRIEVVQALSEMFKHRDQGVFNQLLGRGDPNQPPGGSRR